MKTGAVAMIDALGFKGIWKRADPVAVIAKMQRLKAIVENTADVLRGLPGRPSTFGPVEACILSDTIVLTIARPAEHEDPEQRLRSPDENDWLILYVLAAQVAGLIQHGLSDGPPLTYRGCITFGEYHVEGPFMIGQAVDDAGEGHEAADGAIVWLHPTALTVTEGRFKGEPGATPFVRAYVPMRKAPTRCGASAVNSATPFATLAVNPLWRGDSSAHDDFVRATLQTFTGADARIQLKRENTQRFLDVCRGA